LRRWYAVERPKHPAPTMTIGLPGSTFVIDKIVKALPLFVLRCEAKQTIRIRHPPPQSQILERNGRRSKC
jgi:hypothetical protein